MAKEKEKINFKKLPEMFCKECRKNKKMIHIGGNEDVGIYWMKCPSCHQNYSYTYTELEEVTTGKNIATNSDNGNGKNEKTDDKHEEYSPLKSFYIGQTIYHKVFDDVGQVIEKNQGSDIGGRIVVSFNKSGVKKLVEGMQA